MATSSQKFIARNRAPRVQIEYDVELYGAQKKVQLPFVMGVLSDLSGRYVVVIDGPDVPGPVPSAQLLSLADATLVVVTEGETSIRDARYTGDAMRALAGESVGAVLVQR